MIAVSCVICAYLPDAPPPVTHVATCDLRTGPLPEDGVSRTRPPTLFQEYVFTCSRHDPASLRRYVTEILYVPGAVLHFAVARWDTLAEHEEYLLALDSRSRLRRPHDEGCMSISPDGGPCTCGTGWPGVIGGKR